MYIFNWCLINELFYYSFFGLANLTHNTVFSRCVSLNLVNHVFCQSGEHQDVWFSFFSCVHWIHSPPCPCQIKTSWVHFLFVCSVLSGQSQVILWSLCAYFVSQTGPKILRLVKLKEAKTCSDENEWVLTPVVFTQGANKNSR